ncbi:MAG: hypothetical protein ACYT04_46895 [Nostoc sp.]
MSTTGYAYAQWYEKQRLGRARLDPYWLRYSASRYYAIQFFSLPLS